ncbi:transmembrane protein [Nannochloropsis gaditana]|uniref:Transmembrane protein n=1 Tax=Nannochloropsis gaditana TaxID=72520 RepID=W7TCG7_9STRA|nr:transmembrane protein [Nannochloropsis gaditana]
MGGLHHAVVAITGICAGMAVLLSAALIQQHLTHFSKPLVQSKIVGILWMVPIYSVQSWLSLSFKRYALYLDMFRDCYEAYVLYLFLALLVAYLGDGEEERVVALLQHQPRVKHIMPFKLCLGGGEVPHGADFLRFCKFGTMQYIVLKPACTLAAVILAACGLYGEGSFALNRFWIYQTLIMNVSVGYAFYCLGLFYVLLHGPLEAHNPVPKFLCIKAVLFLSFWQGVVIAALVRLGLLPHFGEWTTQNVAMAVQEVLICVEMMLVAFAHQYAFPVAEYVGAPAMRTGLLSDHFSHTTALRDFNEVMPVLLPSNFTPGLAQSIDRRGEIGLAGGWETGDGNRSCPSQPALHKEVTEFSSRPGQRRSRQSSSQDLGADFANGSKGGATGEELESAPARKLGVFYGFEALGPHRDLNSGSYSIPGSSSATTLSSPKNNPRAPADAGVGGGKHESFGGEGPCLPEEDRPMLSKGEALALNTFPWRLNG